MNFDERPIKKMKIISESENENLEEENNKELDILQNLFSGVTNIQPQSVGVSMEDNHIYFRTSITKSSIFELNKYIKNANENYDIMEKTHKNVNITPKPIYLHISSGGGDLIYSFMGYDIIKNSKIPIYTIIEGNASSGATVLSVAGTKKMALKTSFVLIHQLSTGGYGKMDELEDFSKNNKLFMKNLRNIYLKNTKITAVELDKILKKDIYLDTQTCLKYGIIDEIYDGNQ
jgi:ATP-dependent protease ClpP protease subunit